jgi:retinol dehydrogenase-12
VPRSSATSSRGRLKGTGVSVNCVHPGAVRTHIGSDGGGLPGPGIKPIRPFVMSPEKAARALVYVATSPELEGTTGT